MTEDTIDPVVAETKKAASKAIARALFRAGVSVPALAEEGEDAVAQEAPNQEEWAEKRKDYRAIANKILKKLDNQGFTMTMPEKADETDDDADGDDDE